MPRPSTGESATPRLRCPACRRPMGPGDAVTWACAAGHCYPLVAGILDVRPPLDGFDADADRRIAEDLAALEDLGFESLLRRYWSHHQDVPARLVDRFVHGDVIGSLRAGEVAEQIEQGCGVPLAAHHRVLEVGCGTAALGAVLARRAGWVVASDVSLAWLVLARRRLLEEGLDNVTLVAASGDALPFDDDTFDLVAAADVIEHVPDALAFARACHRVVRPGGAFWLSTPNRFSLTPEPHVRVWGVGWLPRRLAVELVRRVRGVDYHDVRTLSALALRRTLRATGGQVRCEAPAIARAVRAGYAPASRALIDAYHLLRRWPVARQLLLAVAPLFHATVRKV